MARWIDDFLSDRFIQVRVNGLLSDSIEIVNGVPQGSVISPLLFNIMVNDIPIVFEGVNLSQFADDLDLWKTGRNISFLTKKMQVNLNKLSVWCKKWGFKLSPTKTVGVLFTRKRSIPKIVLKLDGVPIKFESNTKFLGVYFDQRLSWAKHVEYIVEKCKSRINVLRCISGISWGANSKLLYMLYRALIRPILEYGCECFASSSKSTLAKLDSVQYKCLKICVGALRGSSLKKITS